MNPEELSAGHGCLIGFFAGWLALGAASMGVREHYIEAKDAFQNSAVSAGHAHFEIIGSNRTRFVWNEKRCDAAEKACPEETTK